MSIDPSTLQSTLPPEPAPGAVQANPGPLICLNARNVVPSGRSSVKLSGDESAGPRFVNFTVKVSGWATYAGVGPPPFIKGRRILIERSACSPDCAAADAQMKKATQTTARRFAIIPFQTPARLRDSLPDKLVIKTIYRLTTTLSSRALGFAHDWRPLTSWPD